MEWNIAEAADKFELVVDKALHEERQHIETAEGVVVLISKDELERIEGKRKTLGEHLLNVPKVEEADFSRDKSLPREFKW